MKLDRAIALSKRGILKEAEVRVSPANCEEWFVMLHDDCSKAFVLADNNDKPIATGDLNELVKLIKSIGLKKYTTFL